MKQFEKLSTLEPEADRGTAKHVLIRIGRGRSKRGQQGHVGERSDCIIVVAFIKFIANYSDR